MVRAHQAGKGSGADRAPGLLAASSVSGIPCPAPNGASSAGTGKGGPRGLPGHFGGGGGGQGVPAGRETDSGVPPNPDRGAGPTRPGRQGWELGGARGGSPGPTGRLGSPPAEVTRQEPPAATALLFLPFPSPRAVRASVTITTPSMGRQTSRSPGRRDPRSHVGRPLRSGNDPLEQEYCNWQDLDHLPTPKYCYGTRSTHTTDWGRG